jgi:hypothetical protein
MLNAPPVIDLVVPVGARPGTGNSVKVNVPTMRVDVTLVIVTLPLPFTDGWL